MNKPQTIAFSCAAFLLCFTVDNASAQRMFKCVDANGRTYYTQVPPRECLGRATEELSRQGSVLKRSGGTLTPEEQAARERERKEKQERDIAEREERRKNRALLSTYSSEQDIEDARARALKDNEVAIKQTENTIAAAMKRKKKLEAEKEFYLKKPMPSKLSQDLKNNEIEIRTQQGLLEAKKKQVADINAKYDEDTKRYRELTKNAAQSQR